MADLLVTQRWFTRKRWSQMLAFVRARPELEQAVLRAIVPALVLVYFLGAALCGHQLASNEVHAVWFAAGFFIFAVVVACRILVSSEVSVVRRVLGIVADNVANTYFILVTGETGALVFGVYLFVSFGNGFRYGRTYLHVSQGLALLGFSVVLYLSDFWSEHLRIGAGMLLAMIVLPLYVGILGDRITQEKKRADEARKRADEANQAKGRFLAIVSHEMRTPLNGVIAMADLLRETSLQGTQREIVQTLSTSAQLALAQIEDVLDMAKLEAGRVHIEQRPFDLGKVLTTSVKVIVPQARYKGLTVNTNVAPEAGRWFIGDGHHLRQILLNLLSNSVKFTEHGEITLSASVVGTVDGISLLRFEVRDTGIGIDPAKQAAIFEAFTQADDSITRVYGGTGLGTTIARQLVALMGGKIGVNSEVGVGSTFWLEVPLPEATAQGIDLVEELTSSVNLSAAGAEARAARHAATVHKMRGARVLVAEDNPTNQRVTELILESGGHVATIVNNGEAALDALERGGFNIALFDLSMPGVSGLEALKLYQFASEKPIPVLILSANVTTEAIAECQAAGAAEFIPKPVRPSVLLEAIERHLASDAAHIPAPLPVRAEERPSLAVVDTPPLDPVVLSDLAKISTDSTFVERLIRGFQDDSERLVAQISQALALRKYEQAKDAAHALKGGAGGVGATQLMQFAVRLEKATHEMLRLKGSQWTDELLRVSARTQAALEEHLDARRKLRSSSQQGE